MIERHRNILDYSVSSFKRKKVKNLGTILVFVLVVFVLASEVFLFSALKGEARETLSLAPDITVQKLVAGRQALVPLGYMEKIQEINGVSRVVPRVWGYYYDTETGATFTFLGVREDMLDLEEDFSLALEEGRRPGRGEVVVGKVLADFKGIRLGDKLILLNSEGKYVKFQVVGIFSSSSNLQTADLVLLDMDDARAFFGIPQDSSNDLMVYVANPAELPTVASKISRILPDTRVLPRDALERTYETIFGWRSGMFLAAMAGMLLAFAILAFDRMSSTTAEEKREVGILKAVGWTTGDILTLKSFEGLIIALNSYLLGVILAYIHVFHLGATLLKPVLIGWSVLYPDFALTPHVDLNQLLLIFFISVVPFMAAIIIPAWKTAVTDPDVAVRGI